MTTLTLLKCLFFLFTFSSVTPSPHVPLQFNTSFAAVNYSWSLIRAHSILVRPVLNSIISAAENALNQRAFSVMNKTLRPPSNDKHDYVSIAVYWWPCSIRGPIPSCKCTNGSSSTCVTTSPTCDITTGLPWVSCDGHMNRAANAAGDQPSIAGLSNVVSALAQGYYWTRNETFAIRAVELVRIWFLEPDTRMNPNLNFGQSFPGVSDNGTFSGLIETDGALINILDSIALLTVDAPCGVGGAPCSGSTAWTEADDTALLAWLTDWSQWLSLSHFSNEALNFFNNHQTWLRGAWFTVSVWLKDIKLAETLLLGAKGGGQHPSICGQIGQGGSLPAEENRVNSIGYVMMDLRGLLNLCAASRFAPFVAAGGAAITGDLYDFQCVGGNQSCVLKAVQYLIPFAMGEKVWPFPSETTDFSGAAPLFRQAAVSWKNSTLAAIAQAIKGESNTDTSILWWNIFNQDDA